jgi:hypothetical protein
LVAATGLVSAGTEILEAFLCLLSALFLLA